MNRSVLITGIWMLIHMVAFTQHQHFVYLQHESSASFYVKYKGQLYRSSSLGYLILSKIPKEPLELYVGLHLSGQQELKFSIDSVRNDRGFLIKQFGDKGWGLYDWQQATIQYAGNGQNADHQTAARIYADTATDDAFGNMLSRVTRDTTVRYVAVRKVEPKKDSAIHPVPVAVPPAVGLGKELNDARILPGATGEKKPEIPQVSIYQKSSKPGYDEFIFLVPARKGWDTVGVQIQTNEEKLNRVDAGPTTLTINDHTIMNPVMVKTENSSVKLEPKEQVLENRIDSLLAADGLKVEEPVMAKLADAPVVTSTDLMVPVVTDSVVVIKDSATSGPVTERLIRTDCRRVADEASFIRLRRKMAGKRTEEQMIEEAVRSFKQNCFTALQVGQLSGMFVTDEMRFRFFEAAGRYVSDPGALGILENYLQSSEYKKKFEALKSRL